MNTFLQSKKYLLICIAIFSLLNIAAAGNSDLFARAKKAAAYDLKDPGSAQFRNIRISALPTIVCGEINGKNSYGAFTGFNLFTYDDKKGKAEIIYPDNKFYDHEVEVFNIMCRNK